MLLDEWSLGRQRGIHSVEGGVGGRGWVLYIVMQQAESGDSRVLRFAARMHHKHSLRCS